MSTIAVIFPGQGAQSVGMGRDFFESNQAAKSIFDRANDVLPFDIASLCFDGPTEDLSRTDVQQPAIFVTSVAIWESFLAAGAERGAFACTGGLSLGEYTALYAAGAFTFEDALRLVHRRGQLMQQAAIASPSGMVTLVGATSETANELCDQVRGDEVLAPANFNCPGQVVISGSKAACDRAVEAAASFECRAIALAVAGAFHSPLMQSAADELQVSLAATPLNKLEMPVYSNVTGQPHGDGDEIRELLCRQVTHPVLWQRCMESMTATGVQSFVEIGPGRVLTGLVRKTDRNLRALNVSKADAMGAGVEAVMAPSELAGKDDNG